MVNLKDNIQSDLSAFKIDDFITASEGSVFSALGGPLTELSSTLSDSVASVLNDLTSQLEEALSGTLDTISDLFDSLGKILDDALGDLGLSLEIRGMLFNLLNGLCNNTLKFDIDISLPDLLFSILLSAAFTITICGNTFGFKTSFQAMLTKDGLILDLQSRYEEELQDYENSELMNSLSDLRVQLGDLKNIFNVTIRGTSDTNVTNIIAERDEILVTHPNLFEVTEIKTVEENLAILRYCELNNDLDEATSATTDPDLIKAMDDIKVVETNIKDVEVISCELTSILTEISDRRDVIQAIFNTTGLQVALIISSSLNNGTIDPDTAVLALADILNTVGEYLPTVITLSHLLGYIETPSNISTFIDMMETRSVMEQETLFDVDIKSSIALAVLIRKYYDNECEIYPPLITQALAVYNKTIIPAMPITSTDVTIVVKEQNKVDLIGGSIC